MVKAMYLSVTDNGVDNREELKDMLISYRSQFVPRYFFQVFHYFHNYTLHYWVFVFL